MVPAGIVKVNLVPSGQNALHDCGWLKKLLLPPPLITLVHELINLWHCVFKSPSIALRRTWLAPLGMKASIVLSQHCMITWPLGLQINPGGQAALKGKRLSCKEYNGSVTSLQ